MKRYIESLRVSSVNDAARLNYLLGATIFFTYLLMGMGTFVTSTGSGLACPDWPLCYGSVKPPLRMDIWFEWGHRLLGGITGMLIILSTFFVWRNYRGTPRFLTATVIALLFVGVSLGGITVLIEAPFLDSFIRIAVVSSHLIISTLVLICLVFTISYITKTKAVQKRGYYHILFFAVYLQVVLGIFVRYSGASLACPDIPLCQGEVIPSFTSYTIALHYLHRLTAIAVFLLAAILLYRAVKMKKDVAGFLAAFLLIMLQATFGIWIVLTGMFLPLIILHGATGFMLLGWLAYKASPHLLSYKEGAVSIR